MTTKPRPRVKPKKNAEKAKPKNLKRSFADPTLTLSVPEAGEKYFGLGVNASYGAAARGDIPTIKIGKFLRVPVRALEAMLDKAAFSATERTSAQSSTA
jgi:hypothetical protein